jgi:hypothetical protein
MMLEELQRRNYLADSGIRLNHLIDRISKSISASRTEGIRYLPSTRAAWLWAEKKADNTGERNKESLECSHKKILSRLKCLGVRRNWIDHSGSEKWQAQSAGDSVDEANAGWTKANWRVGSLFYIPDKIIRSAVFFLDRMRRTYPYLEV